MKFTCEYCGKVADYKFKSWKRKYCSVICYYRGKKKPRALFKCENCGNTFETRYSEVAKAQRRGFKVRFCSNKCRRSFDSLHKKGRKQIWRDYNNKPETKQYKTRWHEKKYYDGNGTILGGKCYMCGTKNNLNIHHRDGNNGKEGKSLNNSPDNLVILCDSCHLKVHSRRGLKEVVPRC